MSSVQGIKFRTSYWYILFGGPLNKVFNRIKDFPTYKLEKEKNDVRGDLVRIYVRKPNLLLGKEASSQIRLTNEYNDQVEFIGYNGLIGFLTNSGDIKLDTQETNDSTILKWVHNPKEFVGVLDYSLLSRREVLYSRIISLWRIIAVALAMLSVFFTSFANSFVIIIILSILSLGIEDTFDNKDNGMVFQNMVKSFIIRVFGKLFKRNNLNIEFEIHKLHQ